MRGKGKTADGADFVLATSGVDEDVMRDAERGGIEEALAVVLRLPKLSRLWQAMSQDG